MGRKKIFESDADRQAAFREKNARLDLSVSKDLAVTIENLALANDVSKNQLCTSMIKFALTNRDWARLGLTHQKLST